MLFTQLVTDICVVVLGHVSSSGQPESVTQWSPGSSNVNHTGQVYMLIRPPGVCTQALKWPLLCVTF